MQTKDSSVEGIMTDIIVAQLKIDREKVTREAEFEKDLGADSLDFLELISAFEEGLKVKIPHAKVWTIKTVGQAFDCVNGLLIEEIPAS